MVAIIYFSVVFYLVKNTPKLSLKIDSFKFQIVIK